MNLVFDSFAIIMLFQKEKGYNEVMDWLAKINDGHQGFMTVINLGEVYYMTCKKQSIERGEIALSAALQLHLEIIEADFSLTYEAAKLKSQFKLSYADAFAAALTIQMKGILITGDLEFKNLQKVKDFKAHFINR